MVCSSASTPTNTQKCIGIVSATGTSGWIFSTGLMRTEGASDSVGVVGVDKGENYPHTKGEAVSDSLAEPGSQGQPGPMKSIGDSSDHL